MAFVQVYGDAFSADAGRCFRWVYRADTTQPMRCPGQPVTRGWWQDRRGRWWVVDACVEHAGSVGRSRPGPEVGPGGGGAAPSRRAGRRGGPGGGRPVSAAA